MPVTAALSREFYEKFGDKLTNELVNWLNQVDATYRADFRELFEVHFARFDAKLDQRTAELRAELEQRTAELRAELREGLASLGSELRTELGREIGSVRVELREGLARQQTDMAALRADVLRWNFLFWIGTIGTIVALMKL